MVPSSAPKADRQTILALAGDLVKEIGTCPVCHHEERLNVMSGKIIQHNRLAPDSSQSNYETCPGSHRSPAESRSAD